MHSLELARGLGVLVMLFMFVYGWIFLYKSFYGELRREFINEYTTASQVMCTILFSLMVLIPLGVIYAIIVTGKLTVAVISLFKVLVALVAVMVFFYLGLKLIHHFVMKMPYINEWELNYSFY